MTQPPTWRYARMTRAQSARGCNAQAEPSVAADQLQYYITHRALRQVQFTSFLCFSYAETTSSGRAGRPAEKIGSSGLSVGAYQTPSATPRSSSSLKPCMGRLLVSPRRSAAEIWVTFASHQQALSRAALLRFRLEPPLTGLDHDIAWNLALRCPPGDEATPCGRFTRG